MMNQYGGFSGAAGLSTVSQAASPGQTVTVQMPPMPAQMVCAMSSLPVSVQCPLCQSMTTTSVETRAGFRAKLTACTLVMAGCCCLIPLLWKHLKDTVHYCSNCQAAIGRYCGQGGAGRRRRR